MFNAYQSANIPDIGRITPFGLEHDPWRAIYVGLSIAPPMSVGRSNLRLVNWMAVDRFAGRGCFQLCLCKRLVKAVINDMVENVVGFYT